MSGKSPCVGELYMWKLPLEAYGAGPNRIFVCMDLDPEWPSKPRELVSRVVLKDIGTGEIFSVSPNKFFHYFVSAEEPDNEN